MSVTMRQIGPCFAAEVSGIDLTRPLPADAVKAIHAGMDEYAVLVFHDQFVTDDEHIAFAQRFDGQLHTKTGISALPEHKSRLRNEALADISNVDETGEILKSDDRRRMYLLGNRLWHTDASFQDPPGRYSML
jgi:alpha-ketoglutarate-dependent 2,4-dichlorophenoxyacetate dioxygenase